MIVAPNMPRTGVVAGFAMALPAGGGLVPDVGRGVLFAQGSLVRPSSGPVVPAAPTDSFSYLAYNATTGWYWTGSVDGATAGDAVIGWAVTNSSDVVAVSHQVFVTGAPESSGVSGVGGGGTGGGMSGGGGLSDTGEYLITVVSGHAAIDLSKGRCQRLVRNGAAVIVDAPVGAITGSTLILLLQQDAAGERTMPTFSTAAGGFVANLADLITFDSAALTQSNLTLRKQANGKWTLIGMVAGVSVS